MEAQSLLIKRIIVITIFLIADIFLGVRWIRLQREEILVPVKNFLEQMHPNLPQVILGNPLAETIPQQVSPMTPFTTTEIAAAVNSARTDRKLESLEQVAVLSQAAQKIVDAIIENNVSFEGLDTSKILTTFLQQKKVENISLFHDTLIGPLTLVQLKNYWDDDADHLQTIASPDLQQIGVATGSAMVGNEEQGVVVIIYGKPQATVQQSSKKTVLSKKIVFPEISNESILQALNSYRATHGIHPLSEHPNLCAYAEKRVQDLVAYKGLDGHEGFKKDFADQENLPESIKSYPGGAIGENLAYQNCRNMQTGEGFMAETATALIEWCFDSSTKGHREAQLNPRFNNACARHQDGYFVIIFGE